MRKIYVATKAGGRLLYGYFTGEPNDIREYLALKGVEDQVDLEEITLTVIDDHLVANLEKLVERKVEAEKELAKIEEALS